MGIKLLSLGAILFVAVHLVPSLGALRQKLVNRLSLNGYKGLFSLLSLLGLGLMIWGKGQADHVEVWIPPVWARQVAPVGMLPAMILLVAYGFPTNIKRFTPHPMLWGVILWSGAHLLANGDLASIILFGAIGAYSVIGIVSANRRGAQVSTRSVSMGREAATIGFGVAAYVALLLLHPLLFGVPVL